MTATVEPTRTAATRILFMESATRAFAEQRKQLRTIVEEFTVDHARNHSRIVNYELDALESRASGGDLGPAPRIDVESAT